MKEINLSVYDRINVVLDIFRVGSYDRAVVIGERSFGKGLVQTTRDLVYNTKLKVTTA